MITLLYLTFGGDIKMDTFEIQQNCDTWFHHNVKVHETKKKVFMKNLYYHEYKGKKVIGYICGDEPPQ
jgi:hypothetical protein